MKNVQVRSAGEEKYRVPIISRLDPISTVPKFGLTNTTATDPPGSLTNGEWESAAWDPATGRINALTPTLGDSATLVVAEGSSYILWIRWEHDSEIIVRPVATLEGV